MDNLPPQEILIESWKELVTAINLIQVVKTLQGKQTYIKEYKILKLLGGTQN